MDFVRREHCPLYIYMCLVAKINNVRHLNSIYIRRNSVVLFLFCRWWWCENDHVWIIKWWSVIVCFFFHCYYVSICGDFYREIVLVQLQKWWPRQSYFLSNSPVQVRRNARMIQYSMHALRIEARRFCVESFSCDSQNFESDVVC